MAVDVSEDYFARLALKPGPAVEMTANCRPDDHGAGVVVERTPCHRVVASSLRCFSVAAAVRALSRGLFRCSSEVNVCASPEFFGLIK
jgi:hypothetical protein